MAMNTGTRPRTSARTAWFVLVILLAFSIAAPLNQSKAPPILPILMDAFHLTVGNSGLLMSVYAMTGLILALPAGLILQRVGFRMTGLLAGGAIIIGVVIGYLSGNLPGGPGIEMMLTGRVIEGVGTSFMAVLAPVVIAMWFTVEKRGSAMGIWSAWVPIGNTTMLLLAPLLAHDGQWQTVWGFGGLYALITMVMFIAVIKPKAPVLPITVGDIGAAAVTSALVTGAAGATPVKHPHGNPLEVLRNPKLWLIGLAFGCFVMASVSFSTYLPTYVSTVFKLPLSQAALLPSINSMIIIIACPLGGILSDRVGTRRKLFVLGMLLCGGMVVSMGLSSLPVLAVVVVIHGAITGLVPTNIFSAGVEAVNDERQSGLAMGIIMVGQSIGMLVGPILFGRLAETAGWPAAFVCVGAVCMLGGVAGWMSKAR